jgi:hypothetical protein
VKQHREVSAAAYNGICVLAKVLSISFKNTKATAIPNKHERNCGFAISISNSNGMSSAHNMLSMGIAEDIKIAIFLVFNVITFDNYSPL